MENLVNYCNETMINQRRFIKRSLLFEMCDYNEEIVKPGREYIYEVSENI